MGILARVFSGQWTCHNISMEQGDCIKHEMAQSGPAVVELHSLQEQGSEGPVTMPLNIRGAMTMPLHI